MNESLGDKLAFVDLAQMHARRTKSVELAAQVLRDSIRSKHVSSSGPGCQGQHPMMSETLRDDLSGNAFTSRI